MFTAMQRAIGVFDNSSFGTNKWKIWTSKNNNDETVPQVKNSDEFQDNPEKLASQIL